MELHAEHISAGYGGPVVIDALSLEIEPGSIVALIGANGSGKSTILKVLSRLLKPASGVVLLDGKAVSSWNSQELARTLAILPQVHAMPEDVLVRDLVFYGRYPYRFLRGNTAEQDKEAVRQALKLTRIEHLADRSMVHLSGGERQRVWLALSLAQQPKVLLLDEPTTFLDIRYQFEVMDVVRNLNEQLALTIVMVLHDLNHAARYAHRLLAVKDGRIVADGTPTQVLNPAVLRDVFGVDGTVAMHCGYPHFIATGSYAVSQPQSRFL